jgi:hypothetical protein
MKQLITIYKLALGLLPAVYRDHYAEPMVRTLEDMMADQPGTVAKWYVWLRTMLDLPATTMRQYIQIGGSTMGQAPNYARQGTILGAVLLLPFFIVIILNGIHPFAASWRGIGYFSVFVLPTIALLLGAAILGRLLITHDLWIRLKSIGQLQKNWMLFAVPFLAFMVVLFAFGHDSAHCLATIHPTKIVACARND